MAIKYARAKEGYKFEITELGKTISRIRSKYESSYPSKQYLTCVPESWIKDGYVREVEDGEK